VVKAKPKPKVVKKKLVPITKLRKKLWQVFSEYIRAEAADKFGNCACVTCGKVMKWKGDGLNVGHFLPQKLNSALIFNHFNVAPQCARCNMSGEGEQWLFGQYIIKKHGQDVLDMLFGLKGTYFKFTHDWLQEKIDHYSLNLRALRLTKNL
jgi:hypothetical protein